MDSRQSHKSLFEEADWENVGVKEKKDFKQLYEMTVHRMVT